MNGGKQVLKIAHVDTERGWRGGQQQVESLIKGLMKKGHLNYAVLRQGSPLEKRVKLLDIPVLSLRPLSEVGLISAHRMNRFFRKYSVDVIQAHTAHAVPLCAIATLWTKIPFVATRRIDYPVGNNMVSRWSYGKSSRVIAVASGVVDSLVRSGLPSEKVRLVHSGIDEDRFKGPSYLTKQSINIPDKAFVVGQVAALSPQKDQITLLKAISLLVQKISSIHLVIVGDGELRKKLENEAQKLNITENVHFLGFKADALSYVKLFDCFCLSSINEGIGGVLIEAMALGVPVISTRLKGIQDVVKDGVNGFLIPPQDSVAMAEKISDVFHMDQKLRTQFIEAGYKTAVEFSVSNTVDKTVQVYKELV